MKRVVDEVRRSVWRKRLARFARSGQTVAAFCAAERVSAPTFYQWKRKLASPSARPAGRRAAASPAANRTEPFVPVRIEGTVPIEIELPNGARVRVPASDLAVLEAAIAATGRLPAGVAAEGPRC